MGRISSHFQLHGTSQQQDKLHGAAIKGSCRRSYKKGVHRRMYRILHRLISGNSIPATGVGVFSMNFTGSRRLSNTCLTLQTEHIAILKALEHSLNNGNGAVVIHTDSKSALQVIRKEDMKENSLLMSSIVACLELHKYKTVLFV